MRWRPVIENANSLDGVRERRQLKEHLVAGDCWLIDMAEATRFRRAVSLGQDRPEYNAACGRVPGASELNRDVVDRVRLDVI